MKKNKVLQIRIEQGTLDNWHNIAKDKSVSLSELVHIAMEKECGVSPFGLGGDSKRLTDCCSAKIEYDEVYNESYCTNCKKCV